MADRRHPLSPEASFLPRAMSGLTCQLNQDVGTYKGQRSPLKWLLPPCQAGVSGYVSLPKVWRWGARGKGRRIGWKTQASGVCSFPPDRRRPTCCSSLPGSPGQRESPALGMCQRANAEDTCFEAGLGPVGNCTCKPVTHLFGLSERDPLLFL